MSQEMPAEKLVNEIKTIFEKRCGDWYPNPEWIEATLRGLQELVFCAEQALPKKLEHAKVEGIVEERERLKSTIQIITLQPGQHKVYFNGIEIAEYSLFENAESMLIKLHNAIEQ